MGLIARGAAKAECLEMKLGDIVKARANLHVGRMSMPVIVVRVR